MAANTLTWYSIWVRSNDGSLSIRFIEHHNIDTAIESLKKHLPDFQILRREIRSIPNFNSIRNLMDVNNVFDYSIGN